MKKILVILTTLLLLLLFVGCQGLPGQPGSKGEEGPPGSPPSKEELLIVIKEVVAEHMSELRGSQGQQGDQGPKGEQGIAGPQGPSGERGPQGPVTVAPTQRSSLYDFYLSQAESYQRAANSALDSANFNLWSANLRGIYDSENAEKVKDLSLSYPLFLRYHSLSESI